MDQQPLDPQTPATPVPAAPIPTTPSSAGPAAAPPAPEADTPKAGMGALIGTIIRGFLNWVVIPVVIVLILHNFVFQAFHVVGTSMVPTLHDTDYLIISKIGATESSLEALVGHNSPYIPKRGEIIVFHYPKDPSLIFIKRVVALPGEHIVVSGGKVTIYNAAHPNGFDPDLGTDHATPPTLGDINEVIPAGELFVMGDNRTPNGSYDSRDWGTLPYHYIIGEATIRLLPVGQAGLI